MRVIRSLHLLRASILLEHLVPRTVESSGSWRGIDIPARPSSVIRYRFGDSPREVIELGNEAFFICLEG